MNKCALVKSVLVFRVLDLNNLSSTTKLKDFHIIGISKMKAVIGLELYLYPAGSRDWVELVLDKWKHGLC